MSDNVSLTAILSTMPVASAEVLDAILSPSPIGFSTNVSLRGGVVDSIASGALFRPACFLSTGLALLRTQEVSAMFTAKQSPASIIAQGNLTIDVE